MAIQQYDAIIIGAGQSGGPLSTAFAKAGWKTAIVEREHIGGTCINEGCTPTKTMVGSARVAYLARRAADYGVHTGPISVDMTVVRKRKRDIVESFRSGSESRIKSAEGLDLFMGEASFIGPKTLEVHLNTGEVHQLSAETICINAGERPSTPRLEGIDGVPWLELHHNYGIGQCTGASVDPGWWLRWIGIWADVSPLWEPGHDRAAWCPTPCT